MSDTGIPDAPSAEAVRLAAIIYWVPYGVPEWSRPHENAGVLAIARKLEAFAAQARAAAIEEAAKIAASYASCGCNNAHGPCNIDDLPLAIAEDIRALVRPTEGSGG